jgi:hypothetical protein
MPLSPPVMIPTISRSLPAGLYSRPSDAGRGRIPDSMPGWRDCFCGGLCAVCAELLDIEASERALEGGYQIERGNGNSRLDYGF